MEVQTARERKLSGVLNDESSESVIPDDILQKRCYPVLMKICAFSSNQTKDDTARSMSIAFDILDRMMCHTKPSLRTFRSLFICVQNYLEVNPEEERQELLQRVFEPASRHGITKGELTGWHKEFQRRESGRMPPEEWFALSKEQQKKELARRAAEKGSESSC